MKKIRLSLGIALTFVIHLILCSVAFADDAVVTVKQEGITVTKKARWVKYDGKEVDKKENPYAQVTFTVDTSNATTEFENTISKGGDTDVVILLDNSVSMNYNDNKHKFQQVKDAAKAFTDDVLAVTEYKVRVGLVSFATTAVKQVELSTDANAIKAKIDPLKAGGGTNIQHAVWFAQNMLKDSKAKNKVIVILTDGYANGKISFDGDDVATGSNDEERTQNQIEMCKKIVSDVKIVGIAYDTKDKDEKALEKMTTKDSNGKKLFYKADIGTDTLISSIKNVFDKVSNVITSYVVGNSLTDIIPEEFDVIEDTISSNDDNVKGELSKDKKNIVWSWGNGKLEKKKYEMSFVMILDKTKVPNKYLKNNTKINTNGEKIDPNIDSLGSSKLCYGSKNIIKLNSPKLSIGESIKDVKLSIKDATKRDSSPETGDRFTTKLFTMMILCAAIVIFVEFKLRQQDDN